MKIDSSVGKSFKKLDKAEMERVFGATGSGSEVQPMTTPLASFVASYLLSAKFKCGGDNK